MLLAFLLSKMLAVGMLYMACYVEMCSLYAHFPESFSFSLFYFKNGCSILAKAFSAFIEIIIGFLVNLLVYCITSVDLQILKNP